MLQLKNVTKIYETKGGENVVALNDVSVNFAQTGLVFLLGKSGSGKSTLLNIAGGLDEPTYGEVVVMGKSSVSFTGSDFDSYRNTYVGFVFQEYNVLNEFNVEDNIALALELQGKTKNNEVEIQKILDEVELSDFAKRKPNTLSGGQKQRIAIARALVKNPQIIMADEPTGALDSATGKQVFDTLKRLSKTRLVLVVSHDREFAEQYGDRIIELKDGHIISDVSKSRSEADSVSHTLTKIDDNTLSVSCGSALSEDDIQEINRFLKSGDGNILISKGEKEIENFRKVNHITESGAKEHFIDTPPVPVAETKEEAHFIRSRLPMRKAFKIGVSNLKIKRIRLAFTIFLAAVSFIMFGLASTMMLFDETLVLTDSLLASDYNYLILTKNYEERIYFYGDTEVAYTRNNRTAFTPSEVDALGDNAFGAHLLASTPLCNVSNFGSSDSSLDYRVPRFRYGAVMPENNPLRSNLLAGHYPVSADELCVSRYFYEYAKENNFYYIAENGSLGTRISIDSEEDLIGKTVTCSSMQFTICGIFDSGELPSEYNVSESYHYDDVKERLFYVYLIESLHDLVLFSEAFETEYASYLLQSGLPNLPSIDYFDRTEYRYRAYLPNSENIALYTDSFAVYRPDEPHKDITFLGEEKSSLGERELIVPFHILTENYLLLLPEDQSDLSEETLKQIESYTEIIRDKIITEEADESDSEQTRPATAEEIATAKREFLDFIKEYHPQLKIQHSGYDGFNEWNDNLDDGTFDIVGVYDSTGYYYSDVGIYCSEEFHRTLELSHVNDEETNYVPESDMKYSNVFVPFRHAESELRSLYQKMAHNPETDILYSFSHNIANDVNYISTIVNEISVVFIWIGVILAVFSALLLFNFISVSISNKKREIGILRAVGARGIDVFKIFFSESGVIVGICLLLALLGTFLTTVILNNVLRSKLALTAHLFVFGPIPILLMIGIAALVAVVATFLPVYFAAKKKPVDSIRAL